MGASRTGARPVVFGEVLFDGFPDGQDVLGGAPFNVAWHLRGFGESPLLVSRVGTDAAGERVLQAMADWGMDISGVQRDPVHPTGRVQVTLDRGEARYDILADQAYDHIAAEELPSIGAAAFLYHGTLALRQSSSRASLQSLMARLDAPRFLDVNLRSPWWDQQEALERVAQADWVKLNEHELAWLGAEHPDGQERAAAFQRHWAIPTLVVTLGASGALALTDQGERVRIRPAGQVAVVDTVGAGDAFASVFLLGQMRAWPLAKALSRAQAFASALLGVRGATVADIDFYNTFNEAWSDP